MNERPDISDLDVRNTQIIAAALLAGVITFAVMAVLIGRTEIIPRSGGLGSLISMVMAGVSVMALLAAAILPSLMGNPSPDSSVAELLTLHRVQTVLRYALMEGACFANLVAYMLEGHWWSLAIVGGLVFLMLTMFPTRIQLEHWIETHQSWRFAER